MIRVQFSEGAAGIVLRMEGHAGAAESGKDIVCAAASMLLYTVAQVMLVMYRDGKLKKRPRIALGDGHARIIARPERAYYAEALHTFYDAEVGFTLLARNYPRNVQVEVLCAGDGAPTR